MTAYTFTSAALRDLRDITIYTDRHWGEAQARRYTAALKRGIADLAAGRIMYTEINETIYPLRKAHIEHHYIFLLVREDALPVVEAILHERSDYMRQLSARIQPRFISGGGI